MSPTCSMVKPSWDFHKGDLLPQVAFVWFDVAKCGYLHAPYVQIPPSHFQRGPAIGNAGSAKWSKQDRLTICRQHSLLCFLFDCRLICDVAGDKQPRVRCQTCCPNEWLKRRVRRCRYATDCLAGSQTAPASCYSIGSENMHCLSSALHAPAF